MVKKLSKILSDGLDYSALQNLISDMGNNLNHPTLRMSKSDLICEALESYTSGYLRYVNNPHCDFVTEDGKYTIEFKFQNSCLTKKDGSLRDTVSQIIMVNTLSRKEIVTNTLPDGYAKYVCFLDQNAMYLAKSTAVKNYLTVYGSGDTIRLKGFPINLADQIFYQPNRKTFKSNWKKYETTLNSARKKLIESYKND